MTNELLTRERSIRRRLERSPSDLAAIQELAEVLLEAGRPAEVLAALLPAARAGPVSAASMCRLAVSFAASGRVSEALAAVDRATQMDPSCSLIQAARGRIALAKGEPATATALLTEARRVNPRSAFVLEAICDSLLATGQLAPARPLAEELTRLRPGARSLCVLAEIVRSDGDAVQAESLFAAAQQIDAAYAPAAVGRARIAESLGRRAEAFAVLKRLIDRGNMSPAVIVRLAGVASGEAEQAFASTLIEKCLASSGVSPSMRFSLWHAIGQIRDREKKHLDAWSMYERAKRELALTYDAAWQEQWFGSVMAFFTPERLSSLPRTCDTSSLPVLVVGMPRSGTTLVEQIIASHPKAAGAGELSELQLASAALARESGRGFPECLEGVSQASIERESAAYLSRLRRVDPDALRVTDKMPHNFTMLGFASMLVPSARVIHCVRDPRDTCVSCFSVGLNSEHSYTRDQVSLAHAYGQYRRLMGNWQQHPPLPIMDCVYEELVAEPERQARRIIDFIGLEWDEACLRFHESKRAVTTASVGQVHQPIYDSSIGRWKRYEPLIGPLLEGLRPWL